MSCGDLGAVHLWNIHHGHLVGQFTAHQMNLGSIVMAVSPCGKYLATADKEGTIKTWDIEVEFTCRLQQVTLDHSLSRMAFVHEERK